MLKIIKKILSLGPVWFLKRLRLAFVSPVSKLGIGIKLFFHYLLHPLAFIDHFLAKYLSIHLSKHQILNVVYDLDAYPITFDFSYFLAGAEAYANMLKKTHIHLWIVKPERGDSFLSNNGNPEYESVVSKDSQDWRITNLLIPIVNISPSVINYSVVQKGTNIQKQFLNNSVFPEGYSAFNKPFPSYDYLFSMLAQYNFRGFESSNQAKIYVQNWLDSMMITSKVISITIRDYGFDTSRNSAFQSWVDFAKYLEILGYKVIFVPDVDNCWDSKYKDIEHICFSEICWNLELRTAFYELCELNYFYSSGIASLAMLNKNTNAISMLPILENSLESTTEIIKSYNPQEGDNPFKYSQDYQWHIFKHDEYENLIEDFVRYKKIHLDA